VTCWIECSAVIVCDVLDRMWCCHCVMCLSVSRTGEVLGSRHDFKMNSVTIDMTTGCLLLDPQSLNLVNSSAGQLQHPQPATEANG